LLLFHTVLYRLIPSGLERLCCIGAFHHASSDCDFVSLWWYYITNLAQAVHTSGFTSPFCLLTVSACGIASSLRACSNSLRFSTYLTFPPVLLFYQSSRRYTTCAIHQSTRRHTARTQIFTILDTSTSTSAQAYDSDKHQYSMYFQREGGRSVAHTVFSFARR